MVGVIRTVKGLAVLALLIALIANVSGLVANSISSRKNCRRIDNMYAQERKQAKKEFLREEATRNRSFNELPKNFKLLNLELTQEAIDEAARVRDRAIEEAKIDRDQTLKEFHSINCPLSLFWGQ